MCRRKQQGSLPSKSSHGLLRSSQCSSSCTRLLQRLGYPKRLFPQGRTPSSIPSWWCWRGLSATPPSTSLTNTVVLQSPSLSSSSSLLNLVTSAKALGSSGAGQTGAHTHQNPFKLHLLCKRRHESVPSGAHRALPAHLSSTVSLQRGSNPHTAVRGGGPAQHPRLPRALRSPRAAGTAGTARPPQLRRCHRNALPAAHQNHSLPKLGTENTPQWMKTPNFASSNQAGSGRASNEPQVGS